MNQRLADLARALPNTPRGQRTPICVAVADELGISLPTVYRKLKEFTVASSRKRRSDAGCSQLTYDEALIISTALLEATRGNDKRLYSITNAVKALRGSGMVKAEYIDKRTGEVKLLSDSAIARALYRYRLHPDQLQAPAPVTELVSLHPNHVWQIDASLCVLYYLKPQADARMSGLQIMDCEKFYKNKPKNIARIAADRVWSYQITDHASGWIYLEYVMGAESGKNFCSVLINAMQERGDADVMHGRPSILMMDPGSANMSAMTTNLCRSLGIRTIPHAPGAARVTGQVENARNIIERTFEVGLRFQPVANLTELNALAANFRRVYNGTEIHSRHGKKRTFAWLEILPEQLVKVPSVETCLALAVADPETRKVTPKMRISFDGQEYDVSSVPDAIVGEKLLITRNPWRDDSVQVVATNDQGYEVFYVVPLVRKNDFGFAETGAVIGEEFRRHAETPAQRARKAAEKLAMGEETDEGVAAARKEKRIPFNGKLKPYQYMDDARLPDFLPRRGTQHDLVAPIIETPPLNVIQIAKRLQPEFADWSSHHLAWLNQHYPDGAKEEQLQAVADALRAFLSPRPVLTVVGGA